MDFSVRCPICGGRLGPSDVGVCPACAPPPIPEGTPPHETESSEQDVTPSPVPIESRGQPIPAAKANEASSLETGLVGLLVVLVVVAYVVVPNAGLLGLGAYLDGLQSSYQGNSGRQGVLSRTGTLSRGEGYSIAGNLSMCGWF